MFQTNAAVNRRPVSVECISAGSTVGCTQESPSRLTGRSLWSVRDTQPFDIICNDRRTRPCSARNRHPSGSDGRRQAIAFPMSSNELTASKTGPPPNPMPDLSKCTSQHGSGFYEEIVAIPHRLRPEPHRCPLAPDPTKMCRRPSRQAPRLALRSAGRRSRRAGATVGWSTHSP